ncbi:MAG: glycosyltransferase family 4 protein [Anaerolineales bacterium]|nr:glycosyltransferase family 4 protein [Anaerolineales bacterium]
MVKHVLFVTPAYPPMPGGGERYVRALAHQLVQQGVAVTAVSTSAQREPQFWQGTGSGDNQIESDEGITVIRCGIRPFPGGRSALLGWRKLMVMLSLLPGSQTQLLLRMARYIPPIHQLESTLAQLPQTFDVVHGFNLSWEYSVIAAWQFARQRNLPFVVTPFAHFGSGRRDRVALNTMMDHQRHILADADAVLTLTSVEIAGMKQWHVTPRHSDVLGGGLDALPLALVADDIRQKYGLQRPFALFVGRANYDKGALHAIEAAIQLNQSGTPLTLAFIGAETDEFQRVYGRLSAAEREWIRPLGFLEEAEKHALLAACAMLVMPSHSDSFGIVFLEAWAHGKPVIGANAGGIPGVVDDGQNGLLVPFADVPALTTAMRTLLTDPARSAAMGQNGRDKVARQYTWERVTERLRHNYELVLRG